MDVVECIGDHFSETTTSYRACIFYRSWSQAVGTRLEKCIELCDNLQPAVLGKPSLAIYHLLRDIGLLRSCALIRVHRRSTRALTRVGMYERQRRPGQWQRVDRVAVLVSSTATGTRPSST